MSREQKRLGLFAAGLVIFAAGLTALLAIHHSRLLVEQGLHQNGVPHVGNNDGYFYLDQAHSLALEGKGVASVLTDPRQSMLLPYALSSLAGADKSTLHLLGAYWGPVAGLSMLLAVLPWGLTVRSRFVMAVSGLLALAAPYWITRTHVGFLDTDSLVPGLCLFTLFCLFRFATAQSRRVAWGGAYLLTLAVLWFWWRPGAYLSAGFMLCFMVVPSDRRGDRIFKAVTAACVLCGVALAVGGVQPFAGVFAYITKHLMLAFGSAGDSLLSEAVSELRAVGVEELGQKSFGSAWIFLPALIGTVVYCVRLRWRAVFLASAWIIGGAALVSQRFIPLFVPVGAFFAAYGLEACCTWLAGFGSRFSLGAGAVRIALLAVSLPLLFAGALTTDLDTAPKSYFSRSDFDLAERVRTSLPAETTLWTWWDYGYFFQYLTGMNTYFDGGTQTDTTCFVAAHPLMLENEGAAAIWMRHFSSHSWKQLDRRKRGAGWPEYVRTFTQSLKNDDKSSVALILPARVYTTVGYLYAFAHVFDETVPLVTNHLELFRKDGFQYDPGAGAVVVPEEMVARGYNSFGAVINATGKQAEALDFATMPDPYLIFSDTKNFLAVTDRTVVDSLLFKLLGLFEYDTTHFEPVFFDYRTGGIWRVR